jgi:hypothetical protein
MAWTNILMATILCFESTEAQEPFVLLSDESRTPEKAGLKSHPRSECTAWKFSRRDSGQLSWNFPIYGPRCRCTPDLVMMHTHKSCLFYLCLSYCFSFINKIFVARNRKCLYPSFKLKAKHQGLLVSVTVTNTWDYQFMKVMRVFLCLVDWVLLAILGFELRLSRLLGRLLEPCLQPFLLCLFLR